MLFEIKTDNAGLGNRFLNTIGALKIAELEASEVEFTTDNFLLNTIACVCGPEVAQPTKSISCSKLGDVLFEDSFLEIDKYFHRVLFNQQPDIVGIHFRGKDFYQWNKNAILSAEFFLDQLEKQDAKRVFVCSDDTNNPIVRDILDGIGVMGIECHSGSEILIHDLLALSACRVIIGSPSTFSLMASIIGGKHVVYSKDFAVSEAAKGVSFWHSALNYKNPYTTITLV